MRKASGKSTTSPLKVRLVGRNCADLRPLLERFPVELLPEKSRTRPDLVVSSGGDGSLLGAEREYPGVPKFPIRDRANNPKCPLHHEEKMLAEFFAGRLAAQSLPRIVATLPDGTELMGLNDIVLSRKNLLATIRYRIRQDGRMLRPQVIADSLILSTAFGSTGYFQSITRGNFQHGLGIACNNPLDGEIFTVLPEDAALEVELLRGPAVVMADNNPRLVSLETGARIGIRLSQGRTLVYGLEAFRCQDCYFLRRNGK